jgi:hypothetical protein
MGEGWPPQAGVVRSRGPQKGFVEEARRGLAPSLGGEGGDELGCDQGNGFVVSVRAHAEAAVHHCEEGHRGPVGEGCTGVSE